MLKIREDIDLKELENYGFKYYENKNYKVYEKGCLFEQLMDVEICDRILRIYTADDRGIDEDTLYDLIQDGLVEKVEDNGQ